MNSSATELLSSLKEWSTEPIDPWLRLRELLEKNVTTSFGRAHHFGSIHTPRDFREAIPVMSYAEYHNWITRAAAGEQNVLACDELIGFERTSGTSSQAKWIPLSKGLQQEFARGLAAWFAGWQARCPEVFAGRAYWAISPPGMSTEFSPGGLPVGMTSDAAYFPTELGEPLAKWLIIPKLSGQMELFFEETANALLDADDLSVISVWSPTFLLGIDAALRRMKGRIEWRKLWPKLARVSCWADASSAPWIPQVKVCLDGIPIEAKGLLATEGVTSLPDALDGSPRLASECHWHEFIDAAGELVEISELEIGHIYEVLLTTAGGLFRYRSGDRVKVVGFGSDGLPRLRFTGRAGSTCDLVGEKLHENQILEALEQCSVRGFMVADFERPGYDLWLEDPAKAPAILAVLRKNPYFDQALAMKQLAPVSIYHLSENWTLRLMHQLAKYRGCRIGDIKIPVLLTSPKALEVASWLG